MLACAGRDQLDQQVEEGLLAPLVCCTHRSSAVLDEPVPGLRFIQAQGGLHLDGELLLVDHVIILSMSVCGAWGLLGVTNR